MFGQYHTAGNSVSIGHLMNFDNELMPTCCKGVYELFMDVNPMHLDTSFTLLEVISDLLVICWQNKHRIHIHKVQIITVLGYGLIA